MPWSLETSLAFRNKNSWIVIPQAMDVMEATWTMHLNGLLTTVESTKNLIILTPVSMVPAISPRFGQILIKLDT